jgi:hemerythrin-like domain-containing protein
MQRSSELASLSREHHVALEVALRLRRATPHDAQAVREAMLGFWREEGRAHFRLEEELVLPAFARYVPSDDPDVVRVLTEHVDIRRRIADLEAGAPADTDGLKVLGELLNAHVRHEERTLFPRIEAALDGEELGALGAALNAAGEDHQPPRA